MNYNRRTNRVIGVSKSAVRKGIRSDSTHFWNEYKLADFDTKQKMKSNPIFIEWKKYKDKQK